MDAESVRFVDLYYKNEWEKLRENEKHEMSGTVNKKSFRVSV